MKTKLIISLSIIASSAILFYSCGGNAAAKMIVKKWQWDSYQSSAYDKQMADLKAAADTTKDSTAKSMAQSNLKMMAGIMESMKSTTMEYKADGSFEVATSMMGQNQTQKGKYSISADGKKLMSTDDKQQKTDTMDIAELTNEKLVLSEKAKDGSTVTITCKAAADAK
jgi:VCBS repeat-containing protein